MDFEIRALEGMEPPPEAKRPRLCAADEVAWVAHAMQQHAMGGTCDHHHPAAGAAPPHACGSGAPEDTGADADMAAAPSASGRHPPRDESLVVFVKGLPPAATDAELGELFQQMVGQVAAVRMTRNAKGVHKGFAYVAFSCEDACVRAVAMGAAGGAQLHGRTLLVARSAPPPPRLRAPPPPPQQQQHLVETRIPIPDDDDAMEECEGEDGESARHVAGGGGPPTTVPGRHHRHQIQVMGEPPGAAPEAPCVPPPPGRPLTNEEFRRLLLAPRDA
ncbi:hypothetical protein FOA52_009788 [Chlamydomonas sp. UWO 241]|nr:hypothetical protein FOA52_009788 [Chlamydomonas sp. UWO 241]